MFYSRKPKKMSIKELFGNRKSFSNRFALMFHNITQFLGALNDNVYKFLAVFLLIDLKGVEHSGEILLLVGSIYVLPFLLFSSSAGIIADRFSKQRIIVAMKAFEVFITIGAIVSFYYRSPFGVYSMLFLLSMQSAIFGPPKYSIIPELVKPEKISKANGVITSSTYVAIILGSFLASFVTQVTGKNFVLAGIFCLVVALIGFGTSLMIPKTIAQKQKQKISPNVIRDVYQTLKICKDLPYMLLVLFCSAFFLFLGAYLQLNIVPFAIESMGLTEVHGGYLFVAAAIGIAAGAVIAGRTSRQINNLGLSCLAIGVTGLMFLFLPLASRSIIATMVVLMILGFGGGLFVVPLDSFTQTHAPEDKRGKIVAAANFLSFIGVLLAPLLIFVLTDVVGLSAAWGFAVMSIFTVSVFLLMARKLSGIFLNFASRKLLHPFYHIDLHPAKVDIKSIKALVVPSPHWTYPALFLGIRSRFYIYLAKEKKGKLDFIWSYFKNIHFIYYGKAPQYVEEIFSRELKLQNTAVPCLFVHPTSFGTFKESHFEKLKERLSHKAQFVVIREDAIQPQGLAKLWKRFHVIFHFDNGEDLKLPKKKKLLKTLFAGKN
ncbi:MAG: MFS transporter [Simkaniaceae bacterium]|nr:MFS transporter [Simkaniaceae bacterium]